MLSIGLNTVLDTENPSLHWSVLYTSSSLDNVLTGLPFFFPCNLYYSFYFYCYFYLKVFADLLVDPQQLLMVTVAIALREIGYSIQVIDWSLYVESSVKLNLWLPSGKIFGSFKSYFYSCELFFLVNWCSFDSIAWLSAKNKQIKTSHRPTPRLEKMKFQLVNHAYIYCIRHNGTQ